MIDQLIICLFKIIIKNLTVSLPNTEQTERWLERQTSQQAVGTWNNLFAAGRCALVHFVENIIGFQMQNTYPKNLSLKNLFAFFMMLLFPIKRFFVFFHPFLCKSLFYGISSMDVSELCHVIGKQSKGFIARWLQIIWFYLFILEHASVS